MILDAVEIEADYNRDLLPGGILGLNASYINQYVKFLADCRLEELGFEAEYKVSNPAKVDGRSERYPPVGQFF